MLELHNVWRTYQVGDAQVVALEVASPRIDDGDFVAIRGPSGSGKSTLLPIIGLLDRPTAGRWRSTDGIWAARAIPSGPDSVSRCAFCHRSTGLRRH